MKNKVELRFVASKAKNFEELETDHGAWELTIHNSFVGEQIVKLPNDIALIIATAIATARDVGHKEGYEKAKKKYKAINDAAGSMNNVWKSGRPWEDADIPMHWNPQWKLNDPRK